MSYSGPVFNGGVLRKESDYNIMSKELIIISGIHPSFVYHLNLIVTFRITDNITDIKIISKFKAHNDRNGRHCTVFGH